MLLHRSSFRLTLSLLLLSGCAASRPLIDIEHAEIIDLTHTFDEHTIYWPSMPSAFEVKQLAYGPTPDGYFFAANAFCTPEHGGTHIDAPVHFGEGRETAAQIPLQKLIAPAIVIDVTQKAAANPDYRLTADDVRAWEAQHDTIAPGTIVLLRTGWGRRYPDRKAYLGDDTPGATDKLHFPSYGEDSARLLIGERRVSVIGVDTASLDHGQSRDFIVHRIMSEGHVPGLENVANLDRVPERGAWVIALPVKIGKGTGGPVRIVALLQK